MAVTTPDAVYRDLLAQLQVAAATAAAGSLAADRVTISPVLSWEGELLRPGVQLIVPGVGTCAHVLGGVGLIHETFEVAVVQQIARDRFASHTVALSDATKSIVAVVNALRGNGAPGTAATGLVNFQAASALSVCRFLGWLPASTSPEDPWMLAWRDRYDVDYEVAFG